MKIFVHGFAWKSTKRLRSASREKSSIWNIAFCRSYCIICISFLLVIGLGQYATWSKQTSVTGNAWVGFLPVVGGSKLCFWGCLLQLDRFTLLTRIRASDSSRLNCSKDLFYLFILFNSLFWVDNMHLVHNYTNPNRLN